MNKLNIPKNILKTEYINNKNSTCKIANKLGYSISAIYSYLKKYNIKIRSMSEATKGISRNRNNKNHFYKDGRTLRKYYCKCSKKIKRNTALYGQGMCNSCAVRRQHIKGLFNYNRKPNKKELFLNSLLQRILFKKYKYIGDGKVLIEGLNPDFINCNGQKKIIELYGDYWHNLPRYKELDTRRIRTYAKYGYKTLIIWERELKDINKLIFKIKEFDRIC